METLKTDDLGLADAAHMLGVSWAQAWRMVLTGRLDATKRGGRWQVSAASVHRELLRREVASKAKRSSR